ncbi:MAG TPA: DNA-3-methyladenine glycosylase I [Dehalococcoidia bacterium]|nr:DNA-3-methyladenine glycosylase I [Dehalococcoidia bacterium]
MAQEHHAPNQIKPTRAGDYLEVMSKAIFQTGISWKVVESKWPGIREAFRDFDALAVASLTEKEIGELSQDTRIIRNRKKVEAIVDNARRIVELDEAHKGFKRYLRSHGDFEATVKDLRKNFRFLGEMGAFYFLYVVGESVPEYEDWCRSRGREPMTASPAS